MLPHIRRSDAELGAHISPEKFRHLLGGVKGAPRHTDKTDMDGTGQPIQVTAPRVDQRALFGGEGEECRKLELAELARHLPHAEIRQLPVIHRACSQAVDGPPRLAARRPRRNETPTKRLSSHLRN